MNEKEELDSEYQDRLLEIQQKCDHQIKVIHTGYYGAMGYADCCLCDAQIRFDIGFSTSTISGEDTIYITWNRLNSLEDFCSPWTSFDRKLTVAEIENIRRNVNKFNYKLKIVNAIEAIIAGVPYPEWREKIIRERGPLIGIFDYMEKEN